VVLEFYWVGFCDPAPGDYLHRKWGVGVLGCRVLPIFR
jgi:hypothetical protein